MFLLLMSSYVFWALQADIHRRQGPCSTILSFLTCGILLTVPTIKSSAVHPEPSLPLSLERGRGFVVWWLIRNMFFWKQLNLVKMYWNILKTKQHFPTVFPNTSIFVTFASYWQSAWPEYPKGGMISSGSRGWLALLLWAWGEAKCHGGGSLFCTLYRTGSCSPQDKQETNRNDICPRTLLYWLPPACFNLLIILEPPTAPPAWTESPAHEPFGKMHPPLPTRLIILFGNQRLSSVWFLNAVFSAILCVPCTGVHKLFPALIFLFTVNQCYYILLECYSFVNWGEKSRSILYHWEILMGMIII